MLRIEILVKTRAIKAFDRLDKADLNQKQSSFADKAISAANDCDAVNLFLNIGLNSYPSHFFQCPSNRIDN